MMTELDDISWAESHISSVWKPNILGNDLPDSSNDRSREGL